MSVHVEFVDSFGFQYVAFCCSLVFSKSDVYLRFVCSHCEYDKS